MLELYALGKTGVYKSSGRTFSKPCSPFVTKLSNLLITSAKNNPQLEAWINSNPEWVKYQNGDLKETNQKESIQLGGGSKKEDKEEEKQESTDNNKFSSHKEPAPEEKEVPEETLETPEEGDWSKYNSGPYLF
jgi:hypothetical protein